MPAYVPLYAGIEPASHTEVCKMNLEGLMITFIQQ